MDFHILGPFEVVDGALAVEIRRTKPRSLLAVLALHAGRAVSADVLVEALWGETPPKSAFNTLQTYISQLRKELGPDIIETRSYGYLLAVAPDHVDAIRFERLMDTAVGTLRQGDTAEGARQLREALALWRGEALADFAFDSFAQVEIARLEELRIVANEELVDAELSLGLQADLVGRLHSLVKAYPLRERLWSQLVTALYRSGRQAEGLRALADVRRLLREDLGIEPGAALRQLEEDVLLQRPTLDGTARPSVTMDNAPALPSLRSSFVGRIAELTELDDLTAFPGLVTLVGPGGVGKTRLSLEVAGRVRTRFSHGVWLVELAALTEPDLVGHAIAEALAVREEPGRSLVDTLSSFLAGRRLLLILDNCEHLVDAAASMADSLLAASPLLGILATSREPLRIPGERVYPLAPLPLPSADETDPEQLSTVDAVRLFTDRATAQGSFSLVKENASEVAALCRRLDGIPLGIELAAARVRTVTPAQMLLRLDDRFDFLTAGARTALPRHQTLRAAVDWSYDLLDSAERTLFRRLAVFAGNFNVEAVSAVCAGTSEVEKSRTLELLASLVDHSLVVPIDVRGERRFTLLETLRAYASERLAEAGEERAVLERLVRWAVTFTESFAEAFDPRRVIDKRTIERLEAENENLRRALGWVVSTDPPTGLRLLTALGPFWTTRGYTKEARQWAETLLITTADAPTHDRAHLLRWAAQLAIHEGDMGAAQPHLEEALDLLRDLGDARSTAIVLDSLTRVAVDHLADLQRAERLQREMNDIYAQEQDDHLYSEGLGWLAITTLRRGDVGEAQRLSDEGLTYNHRHADDLCPVLFQTAGTVALLQGDYVRAKDLLERGLAQTMTLRVERAGLREWRDVSGRSQLSGLLNRLGELAFAKGDDVEAHERFTEQLANAKEVGDRREIESALRGLALVAIRRGDGVYARSAMDESRRIAGDRGRTIVPEDLESVAALLRSEGRVEDAALLLGAAEARRGALGMVMPPVHRSQHEPLVADVVASLGAERFAEAWAAGRQLCAEDALDVAFDTRLHTPSTR